MQRTWIFFFFSFLCLGLIEKCQIKTTRLVICYGLPCTCIWYICIKANRGLGFSLSQLGCIWLYFRFQIPQKRRLWVRTAPTRRRKRSKRQEWRAWTRPWGRSRRLPDAVRWISSSRTLRRCQRAALQVAQSTHRHSEIQGNSLNLFVGRSRRLMALWWIVMTNVKPVAGQKKWNIMQPLLVILFLRIAKWVF